MYVFIHKMYISAYALWKRLISSRKISIRQLWNYVNTKWPYNEEIADIDVLLEYACRISNLTIVIWCSDKISMHQDYLLSRTTWRGHFLIVRWLCHIGYDPTYYNSAIQQACRQGHLQIAKWLYSIGCDPMEGYNLEIAIENGHLRLAKWLYSLGCRPITTRQAIFDNQCAIKKYAKMGDLKMVKWLYSIGYDPTVGNNYPIRWACKRGHLEMVKWLYSIGCDPHDLNGWAMHKALCMNHMHVVEFLKSIA